MGERHSEQTGTGEAIQPPPNQPDEVREAASADSIAPASQTSQLPDRARDLGWATHDEWSQAIVRCSIASFGYALRWASQSADAHDVAQETVEQCVWYLKPEYLFEAYAIVVCRRILRRRQIQQRRQQHFENGTGSFVVDDQLLVPEDGVLDIENTAKLTAWLGSLSEQDRRIFETLDQHSDTAANLLNMTAVALRKRRERIRHNCCVYFGFPAEKALSPEDQTVFRLRKLSVRDRANRLGVEEKDADERLTRVLKRWRKLRETLPSEWPD